MTPAAHTTVREATRSVRSPETLTVTPPASTLTTSAPSIGVTPSFFSERSAREDYGVVLAGKPLSVDEAATRAVREKLRHARNWPHEPMISWEPPVIAMAAE